MKIWALLLYAFGIVAGFGVGLLSSDRAFATNYAIKMMGGADSYLNCGWHGECDDTPTSGVALDWRAYYADGHQVYFRAFMYRSSGSTATVARGYPETVTGGGCQAVWVHIASTDPSATYRGTITYTHTSLYDGTTFDITGSTTGAWNQRRVASTNTSETGCPSLWSAEHLHQLAYWQYPQATGSTNTDVYPGYVNAGSGYYIDAVAYYTHKGDWSY